MRTTVAPGTSWGRGTECPRHHECAANGDGLVSDGIARKSPCVGHGPTAMVKRQIGQAVLRDDRPVVNGDGR